MDKLFISGLELWMKVGCTPEERAFPQLILMDVELETPLRAAGQKDDMQRTVDYAEVINRLKIHIESESYRLLESVAEDAAGLILKRFKVRRVTVRLRKRALPALQNFGVEITRP
jgi:7,8-dihydroneopterin aldolase/epimerase/oxygenase